MSQLRKIGHYTKDCCTKKKVKENTNLIEKDETKDEGILMIVNKGVTLDSGMVWYLGTSANNHMCAHKQLFVDIQEMKDEYVSFGDLTHVSVKGLKKNVFLKRMEKKVLRKMSIMYLT